MGKYILVGLVLAFAGGAYAQNEPTPCEYTGVDIGELATDVPGETITGPALFAALKDNPECGVVAIEYTCRMTEWANDYVRFFYDRDQKMLVLMGRMAMRLGSDSWRWFIWYDVEPEDFKDRIPYGRDDLKTKMSPGHEPKLYLLEEYDGPEKATVWP